MPDTTPVSEVMTRDVITLRPDDTFQHAAEVLSGRNIGAAPVVDPLGAVVGLLQDEDLLVSEANLHAPTVISFLDMELVLPSERKRFEEELRRAVGATVGDVMTKDVMTAAPGDSLEDVATQMHDHDVSHVPVVEAGRLVGIVARGDIIRFLARTA
jgi:CBS domain-containing protein